MTLYANYIGYSDIEPFEVVMIVSPKTYVVRSMKCEPLDWDKHYVNCGFVGHILNQGDQKWVITSDKDGDMFRIRLNKAGWRDRHGGKYILSKEPRKFYDYNF